MACIPRIVPIRNNPRVGSTAKRVDGPSYCEKTTNLTAGNFFTFARLPIVTSAQKHNKNQSYDDNYAGYRSH